MSEWHVHVVQIGPIEKHPNADSLGVTRVYDYPCIVRLGEFSEGERVVYIPVDSVVPADDPRWAFLDGHLRIRAKKLRGIYSQGLLTKADPAWELGQDVHAELRITKYEPPEDMTMGGENEHCPFTLPTYTDIEGLRRYPDILQLGEEVVISEKLDGANMRAVWQHDRLWVASHHNVKARSDTNMWWKCAAKNDLEAKLQRVPGVVIYGEVYGHVGGMLYGHGKNALHFAAFDAFDIARGHYLDYDELVDVLARADLPRVPILYRGPWKPELRSLAEGESTIDGAKHVREGCVVKPVRERLDDRIGRVILKLVGEQFLLRKGG
jgi:RNA ligase (TIGR02306 family)